MSDYSDYQLRAIIAIIKIGKLLVIMEIILAKLRGGKLTSLRLI